MLENIKKRNKSGIPDFKCCNIEMNYSFVAYYEFIIILLHVKVVAVITLPNSLEKISIFCTHIMWTKLDINRSNNVDLFRGYLTFVIITIIGNLNNH